MLKSQICAAMAQMVERILGKDEVTGSIPVSSSRKRKTRLKNRVFSFSMKRSLREHEDAHANEAAFGYEECLRHIKGRFASYERKRVLHLIP